MRSNILTIDMTTGDLPAILRESEKVAVYNELDPKQTSHLRLLCEELDGMLPELVGDFEGKFFIEFVEKVCRIQVSISMVQLDVQRKEELLSIAKNKKNAAAKGIVGKIRAAVDDLFLSANASDYFGATLGGVDGVDFQNLAAAYSKYWCLSDSKNAAPDAGEDWDELEKSVIASLADDVIVGVVGNRADIIIVKNF